MIVLVLLTSINSNLIAQQTKTGNIFELPDNTITRIFYKDLDKGDKLKFELVDFSDLEAITDFDSLVRAFVQDIEPLKDSLADDLSSKKIDYIIDPSGKNKIRIQQFAPKGSSYLINQGTVASLKLSQDTVNFLLTANGGAKQIFGKRKPGHHYFRISIIVNNLSNLTTYMNGRLQNSIREVQRDVNTNWIRKNDQTTHVKRNTSIYSDIFRGQVTGSDYITFRVTADMQNYKNYFVPSLSVGVILVTNRYNIKREFSFWGESHFTFAKNDEGKLQTFRNSFLTLGYNQTNTNIKNSVFGFSPSFSFGWLARQRGNIFEKNTFRIGFGKASIGNVIKLEPVIYFTDFFKGITPGIRLSL